jgi:DNA modification methylase
MGSGTTGVACAAEGFRFWGCDENAEYIQIATARVSAAYNAVEEATA